MGPNHRALIFFSLSLIPSPSVRPHPPSLNQSSANLYFLSGRAEGERRMKRTEDCSSSRLCFTLWPFSRQTRQGRDSTGAFPVFTSLIKSRSLSKSPCDTALSRTSAPLASMLALPARPPAKMHQMSEILTEPRRASPRDATLNSHHDTT